MRCMSELFCYGAGEYIRAPQNPLVWCFVSWQISSASHPLLIQDIWFQHFFNTSSTPTVAEVHKPLIGREECNCWTLPKLIHFKLTMTISVCLSIPSQDAHHAPCLLTPASVASVLPRARQQTFTVVFDTGYSAKPRVAAVPNWTWTFDFPVGSV